jgi:hypothetical protein
VPDMNDTTTYRDLLTRVAAAFAVDADPDGLAARQALLLAAHAGIRREDGTGGADWDLFTVAISQAIQDLQADLGDPVILVPGLPAPGPDTVELRRDVVDLVRRLADRYATAAAGGSGRPWRRLVWAQVAHRLDDAVAELA